MELCKILAQAVEAYTNVSSGTTAHVARNGDMASMWRDRIANAVKEHMPSGSGFDNGTDFDIATQTPNCLTFDTAFHHMNEVGMYTKWTEHSVIVTPSLAHDFDIRVTGRNQNGIKDYIADCFRAALRKSVTGWTVDNRLE